MSVAQGERRKLVMQRLSYPTEIVLFNVLHVLQDTRTTTHLCHLADASSPAATLRRLLAFAQSTPDRRTRTVTPLGRLGASSEQRGWSACSLRVAKV